MVELLKVLYREDLYKLSYTKYIVTILIEKIHGEVLKDYLKAGNG